VEAILGSCQLWIRGPNQTKELLDRGGSLVTVEVGAKVADVPEIAPRLEAVSKFYRLCCDGRRFVGVWGMFAGLMKARRGVNKANEPRVRVNVGSVRSTARFMNSAAVRGCLKSRKQ